MEVSAPRGGENGLDGARAKQGGHSCGAHQLRQLVVGLKAAQQAAELVVVGVMGQARLLAQQVAGAVHQPAIGQDRTTRDVWGGTCKVTSNRQSAPQFGGPSCDQCNDVKVVWQGCACAPRGNSRPLHTRRAGQDTEGGPPARLLRKLDRSLSLLNSDRRTEASRTCEGGGRQRCSEQPTTQGNSAPPITELQRQQPAEQNRSQAKLQPA
jgi:hypothetical protein